MNEKAKTVLPPIPAKRYFTIGEVSDLCMVKPHVLRYWEQEFTQLRPMKRRGNRRYYQHHEVLLVRRIRDLLYEQGFTISGARNQLGDRGLEPELEAAPVPDTDLVNLGETRAQQFDLLESQGSAGDQEIERLAADLPKARAFLLDALRLLS